jgi:hypothetical protein
MHARRFCQPVEPVRSSESLSPDVSEQVLVCLMCTNRQISVVPEKSVAAAPLSTIPNPRFRLGRSHPSISAALSALLRRLRQKMANNGLPDPVENIRGRGFRLLQAIRFNALDSLPKH